MAIMWLFLTSRLRTWLLLTVVVPLATGLLRRVGQVIERRTGATSVTRALYKASDLGDRARATLRGGRRRR
jgi:formate hydrogenlyase subunit 4